MSMATNPDPKKEQHLYKVCPLTSLLTVKVLVIGDYAVGKTSIIKRYCEGYFTPNYKLTMYVPHTFLICAKLRSGVDFAVKTIEVGDKTVSLQVCTGEENFTLTVFSSGTLPVMKGSVL